MAKSLTKFAFEVYEATKKVPQGHVATYLDIAKLIGRPHAYRAVGNALHHNPQMLTIPCHRIVSSSGRLATNFGFNGKEGQKELLEQEGVIVINYRVDLTTYRIRKI